ncbi:hypothetical protein OJAV_G00202970 [Oryzias javanicus]|uniref:Uncharacterized protein n=1 Tax=Oryzias javanicus TaxID=123683 RepID=A0A3S2M0U9_ORYJA|nr:hypothetical protein OJAV_G00202970 [Oryzias javanicus]
MVTSTGNIGSLKLALWSATFPSSGKGHFWPVEGNVFKELPADPEGEEQGAAVDFSVRITLLHRAERGYHGNKDKKEGEENLPVKKSPSDE